MVFVSSAVLGAAAGTGLALLVAVTIVMYRYYVVRRKGKEWAELDRLEEKKAARKINLQVWERGSLNGTTTLSLSVSSIAYVTKRWGLW